MAASKYCLATKSLRLASLALIWSCLAPLTAQAARTPQPTAGPGSIGGVWISPRFGTDTDPAGEAPRAGPQRTTSDGKPVQVLPWALKVMEQRIEDARNGRPYADTKSRCLPSGTPGSMSPPASLPLQIIESEDQVTILFEEFNVFRIIHLDEPHSEDPNPGYFGDSVGHWEGDTLVVDTIGLGEQTSIGGVPHTDKLHVVEKIRRRGDILEMERTFDDPGTFSAPWVQKATLKRVPGLRVQEYFCDNDRNLANEAGVTGVQMPSGR